MFDFIFWFAMGYLVIHTIQHIRIENKISEQAIVNESLSSRISALEARHQPTPEPTVEESKELPRPRF